MKMAVLQEADLISLLEDAPQLKDRSDSEDYSFLAETILPTLLPGLVMLQERLETSGMVTGHDPLNGNQSFNAIRWLAEYLSRHHPRDGVFAHESAYSTHLGKSADILKEQRIQREKVRLEAAKREEEETLQRERERVAAEEQGRIELAALRTRALEATLNERNRKGEKAAMDAMGIDKAAVILTFRNHCMKLMNSNFRDIGDTSEIDANLFKEACRMLVSHSPASFAAVVSLQDTDTLHYHTAANKVEFVVDDDADEEQQGGQQEVPPPEITVKDLPPLSDDSAYILKRGSGVSWSVIDELTPKVITDTKYTENMVFFDGEKRKGTFLAVHLLRENRVAGMLAADTLDSTTGVELSEADIRLFTAVSVVLSECLDKAAWLLMDAKRQIYTEKLRLLSSDPSCLPEQLCVAVVEAIDAVAPGCLVSVGMMDSAMTLRLVHRSKSDNTKESNKIVTVKDKGKDIPAIFQCFQIKSTSSTKNDKREIDSLTVPVIDEDRMVSAAIYVANDHVRNRLADKETIDFIETAAQLVAPVLLTAPKAAIRRLKILAESSIGDPSELFELAIMLSQRHTGASDVFIAMAHGPERMRIVKTTEGWYANGAFIDSKEKVGCFEALRSAEYYSPSTDYVVAPLIGNSTAFGVICLKISFLDGEQQSALEGIALGLSSALKVSELRRKMVVCGRTALQSLTKRATCVSSAYLCFFDVNGRQVCAQTIGQPVNGIEVGKVMDKIQGFETADITSSRGGPRLGLIGAFAERAQDEIMAKYDETASGVLGDCAATMGNVAEVLTREGILVDATLATTTEAEHMLPTHFKAARFHVVTEQTIKDVDMLFIDKVKTAASPHPIQVAITQSIMYILGHQQRDVSEWPKCRKLLTHHLFKEMKMIDARSQLKVHKLKLAKQCVEHLTAVEIDQGAGHQCLKLWNWVRMILEVQGLD